MLKNLSHIFVSYKACKTCSVALCIFGHITDVVNSIYTYYTTYLHLGQLVNVMLYTRSVVLRFLSIETNVLSEL